MCSLSLVPHRATAATPRLCLLGVPPPSEHRTYYEGFFRGLKEFGYEEGRTVMVDYRAAGEDVSRFGRLAEECVRQRPDVIVAATTPATLAAKRATQTIPIVMMGITDPLSTGIVKSLGRPEGNVTGQAGVEGDIAGKRLEILRELVPGLRRLLVITYSSDPTTAPQLETLRLVARRFGIGLVVNDVRSIDELPAAFSAGVQDKVDAVLLTTATIFGVHRKRVMELVTRHRLPIMGFSQLDVEAGALSSYGIDWNDLRRGSAAYVDKILKGARPSELPVAQVTRFQLWFNARAARALGITIPPTLLLRADGVIE
jgi:putative ABC transport system substrate-binding protein